MESKYKYRVEIQQMMFVSGATSDPPLPTVMVVEDIVREQVVELLNSGIALARRRGARSLSVEDVMYLIRHDTAKVNRLSTYLAWKDVRKNARDQDSGATGGPDAPELMEDPSTMLGAQDKRSQKPRRIGLPWKPNNMFAIPMSSVPGPHSAGGDAGGDMGDDGDGVESDDEDNEGTQIMNERLRSADIRTQNMTKEEYVHWSECRQASFTFRKPKRFKEWAGIAHITDARLQDDIMDVLGFLTFETVANITGAALKVKDRWESRTKRGEARRKTRAEDEPAGVSKESASSVAARRNATAKRTKGTTTVKGTSITGSGDSRSLFKMNSVQETPLQPEHIRAAYSQFEAPSNRNKALKKWGGGRMEYATKFV